MRKRKNRHGRAEHVRRKGKSCLRQILLGPNGHVQTTPTPPAPSLPPSQLSASRLAPSWQGKRRYVAIRNGPPLRPFVAYSRHASHARSLSTQHIPLSVPHISRSSLDITAYSPPGMLSTSSARARQLSACSSAYLTRSCAQSWCSLPMLYWVFWKKRSSSRMHSFMKMPRACWATMDSLSCGARVSMFIGRGAWWGTRLP